MDKSLKRLFVGTFLAEEDRERIREARISLEPVLQEKWKCRLRWVRPEKLHMTWLFLGDCDAEQEKTIANRLDEITKVNTLGAEASVIDFDRFDFFPSKSKRSCTALLPSNVPDDFSAVARTLRRSLHEFCEKKESQELRPHLTIFRFERTDRRKYTFPEELDASVITPVKLDVSSLALICSHLGSSKDDYEVLRSYRFNEQIE
jgi:2'-5' RNA ligase